MKSLVLIVALSIGFSNAAHASWLVKQKKTASGVEVISVEKSKREIAPHFRGVRVERSLPMTISEDRAPSPEVYEEILYSDEMLPASLRALTKNSDQRIRIHKEGTEVRTLISQGPKENRVNLTMMGDGYTLAEKEKFFSDAQRIASQVFADRTFGRYLPLFNVYAVFVPSNDSGITDTSKKDTAFGLYRDPPGSKRAIYSANPGAIDATAALAPATDYSVIIANDDFYGGIGGGYTITTRSERSGVMVLRHELGHSLGQVGEEYDSGFYYYGANNAPSTSVNWLPWVSNGHLDIYETLFLDGSYIWQPLANNPYSTTFTFPQPTANGGYSFEVIVSTVGWETPDDVTVTLDGQKMELQGDWTADRSFLHYQTLQSLAPGQHTIQAVENVHDGDNVLAFVEVYAHPPGFDWTPGKIGAYATYNESGQKMGYRPTHSACLMRDVTIPDFCPVDRENMWTKLISRVNLIDAVNVSGSQVTLSAIALPGLSVHWFQINAQGNEVEIPSLANQTSWTATSTQHGTYRVKASFRTQDVLQYTPSYDSSKDFSL